MIIEVDEEELVKEAAKPNNPPSSVVLDLTDG
jgi:hypothetical protein